MLTHSQAKEVSTALTKEGDPNATLSALWALFRLMLEMGGGEELYTKITGKSLDGSIDVSGFGGPPKLETAGPIIPTVPISTNPSLPPKKPG